MPAIVLVHPAPEQVVPGAERVLGGVCTRSFGSSSARSSPDRLPPHSVAAYHQGCYTGLADQPTPATTASTTAAIRSTRLLGIHDDRDAARVLLPVAKKHCAHRFLIRTTAIACFGCDLPQPPCTGQ